MSFLVAILSLLSAFLLWMIIFSCCGHVSLFLSTLSGLLSKCFILLLVFPDFTLCLTKKQIKSQSPNVWNFVFDVLLLSDQTEEGPKNGRIKLRRILEKCLLFLGGLCWALTYKLFVSGALFFVCFFVWGGGFSCLSLSSLLQRAQPPKN